MKVYAPGKLILSGEHAVVYGNPALAMAINRYAVATVSEERLPQILVDLADLAHRSHFSISALRHLKARIKAKYQRFIHGDFSIREVLQKPFELAQFALGVFADNMNLSLPHGVKIHVQSDIPIGCGMGSSAATIMSVMHAISRYLQVSMSDEMLFQLALEAENMQHGRSSGLDLRVAQKGGCVFVEGGVLSQRPLPLWPLYLVQTGTPLSTTGQCIEKVAPHFQTKIMNEKFLTVTRKMDAALLSQSRQDFLQAIAANHQLLLDIGVVPLKVQQFIAQVEALNGAAKICGAGAIMGDQAGAVLVLIEDERALMGLCQQYGYLSTVVVGEARGMFVVA